MVNGTEVIGCRPDLGPEHSQDEFLFLGHAVGDRHHELLVHQRRYGRQGNSRIARTRLDEILAVEFAPLGHPFQQEVSRAILDGAKRIEPFQLQIQLEVAGRDDPRQTDQWRWIGRIGD